MMQRSVQKVGAQADKPGNLQIIPSHVRICQFLWNQNKNTKTLTVLSLEKRK